MRWLKYWSFRADLLQNGLVGSPCSPRDSQESPTQQFESISSSVLSLHYDLTLTSHDDWKSQSFDYTDLCEQDEKIEAQKVAPLK